MSNKETDGDKLVASIRKTRNTGQAAETAPPKKKATANAPAEKAESSRAARFKRPRRVWPD